MIDSRSPASPEALAALAEMRPRFKGEIRADQLSRALYATDASIYEIIPDAVVLPRSTKDVIAAIEACAKYRVPLTPRGAGTGLAGGAVNQGIQLDCSRHLNRILEIDPNSRTARVQPGVVLDELNARIAPHGLHFAPDVATSSRATIGGMISNNSCGAHSIIYGRTIDHVRSVTVVLSDGSTCRWGHDAPPARNPLAERCEEVLANVARDEADEIAARYPKVLRRNGGYMLDRLELQDGRINPEKIICGSEGTLAVVVEATLDLTPLPKHRGLVVAHFADLLESLAATPAILEHDPAAVELIDRMIIDAAFSRPAMERKRELLSGEPETLLIVELFDEDEVKLGRRLQKLADDLERRKFGYARTVFTDPRHQADIWEIRKSGLGLMMSRPGDDQPYAFVEDTAVDPSRLRDYIERFARILAEEEVEETGYYAHASVGCLHVRPVLNLKRRKGVEQMRRIADRVSTLALEFGGTMTGEHGDGLLRSCWLEKMYGPRIIAAFEKIKRTFDPQGILNPGKIVSPRPMTDNLRYGPAYSARPESHGHDTALDFKAYGGLLGMAEMCSGVGQCRQRLVGTMCPSYMATADEKHTTRARANALRMALSNRDLLDGLADPALDEVMDLCLSCKACKSECPTGVDMAALKAEWLWRRYQDEAPPLRSRLIASIARAAKLGSLSPGLTNSILQSSWMRRILEKTVGFDRRVPPPIFARETFRQWFERNRGESDAINSENKPTVIYFVDTWTNHFTPHVGIALVRVLEALGYAVVVPPTVCCGRPAISKGLLDDARSLAEENVNILAGPAKSGIPIIGTEPSCLLTLADELPQLVRSDDARNIARAAATAESFIARALESTPEASVFERRTDPIRYHGHCHQKAMVGTADAMAVLHAVAGERAVEINSGCCGMAGSFGHEVEHYDVAKAVGEQRLFPAVRNRGDARIAVSGFSCRHQIEHHTGVSAYHVIEILADALASKPRDGIM